MRNTILLSVLLALIFSYIGGCSKKTKFDHDLSADSPRVQKPYSEKDVSRPGKEEPLDTLSLTHKQQAILEGRSSAPMLPIYFDFDRSNIRQDQRGRLEENGIFLENNPRLKIRIEGNCDEKGSSEYNIALGEKRALSVRNYLINLGIEPIRLETISYGEERPLLFGHSELSWAQNRRDDFVTID